MYSPSAAPKTRQLRNMSALSLFFLLLLEPAPRPFKLLHGPLRATGRKPGLSRGFLQASVQARMCKGMTESHLSQPALEHAPDVFAELERRARASLS